MKTTLLVSRLLDPVWQQKWLGPQVTWNVTFLHLVGHPIPAVRWTQIESWRTQGISPETAAQMVEDES